MMMNQVAAIEQFPPVFLTQRFLLGVARDKLKMCSSVHNYCQKIYQMEISDYLKFIYKNRTEKKKKKSSFGQNKIFLIANFLLVMFNKGH